MIPASQTSAFLASVAPPGPPYAMDPANKSSLAIISNNAAVNMHLAATSDAFSDIGTARGIRRLPPYGNWYTEALSSWGAFSLVPATFTMPNNVPGFASNDAVSWFNGGDIYRNSVPIFEAAAWIDGLIGGFAVNMGLRRAWSHANDAPAVWFGNGVGTQDPATGQGGYDFSWMTGDVWPAWTANGGEEPGPLDAYAGAAAFNMTPPVGFQALNLAPS